MPLATPSLICLSLSVQTKAPTATCEFRYTKRSYTNTTSTVATIPYTGQKHLIYQGAYIRIPRIINSRSYLTHAHFCNPIPFWSPVFPSTLLSRSAASYIQYSSISADHEPSSVSPATSSDVMAGHAKHKRQMRKLQAALLHCK